MDLINEFQKEMKSNCFTAYIVPTSDYHNSEYVSDYFKGRSYLSGFTGSAGVLLIMENAAYLWTDGRYYIQAAKQIEGKHITLMRQGTPGVPTLEDFLKEHLKEDDTLAFDGKVMTTNFVNKLKKKLNPNVRIESGVDLIKTVWKNRPSLPFSVLYQLDTFYSGKEYSEKLKDIDTKMKSLKADIYIISSLEDQAWLYNLRGNDVEHTPVFLAYTIINEGHTTLFIDTNKIDLLTEKYLDENDIVVRDYEDIYDVIKQYVNKKIYIDGNKVNYQIYSLIAQNNEIINGTDLTLLPKSIKNKVEIENTKAAHIKDGACVAKFMKFVKEGYKDCKDMTELSVSNYLAKLREETPGFVDLSFSTICAFKEHAAMMHYSATPETSSNINEPGFLLVDSGGHYLEGTTDITRTIALGEITPIMKRHFTLVLKSVIALSQAIFLKGCNGQNLDILARGPIWKELIDYKCGTGHGVGYLLSVHEAPNGFRWQKVAERNDSAVFYPGMITTNEPGIYLENEYGIRTENEMLCVDKGKSEFGEFLGFENITFAPIDLDAIDFSLLNKEELDWLNKYHEEVYNKLSLFLNDEEKEWLRYYTREIK